jgi:hypothetical protein
MRTTLDIDDDVLAAAREIARQQGLSIGKVVAELARHALTPREAGASRNGIALFPIQPGATIVTSEMVRGLMGEAN